MNKKVWLIALGLVSVLPVLAFASSDTLKALMVPAYDFENLPDCNESNVGMMVYSKDLDNLLVCSSDGYILPDGYNVENLKREDGKNMTIAIPDDVIYKKITIEDQQERKP